MVNRSPLVMVNHRANFLMSCKNARRELLRQIMGGKELAKQGCLVRFDGNAVENIITTILHVISP